MAGGISIEVEGLKETLKAFDELGGELPERLRGELRDVADKVSDAAAYIAASKGDIYKGAGDHGDPARHDGDLVQKISVRKSGRGFAVVEYSKTRTKRYPGGYPYPRRLEFENGGARAFMRPAAAQMTPYAVRTITEMIDRLTAEKGF